MAQLAQIFYLENQVNLNLIFFIYRRKTRKSMAQLAQFVSMRPKVSSIKYDDLPSDFASLYALYENYDVISEKLDGWLPMALRVNQKYGSSLNENYCFYIPGHRKYQSCLPITCQKFKKSMVWNNKIFYLISIGASNKEICQMMGLVHYDQVTGEIVYNYAPITERRRNT